jgi:hypothetical protein
MPEVKRNKRGEIVKVVATGKDGLVGYLIHIATTEPRSFVSALLARVPLRLGGRSRRKGLFRQHRLGADAQGGPSLSGPRHRSRRF